ncbi:MFS transporter [Stenotrophomonas sp. ESTM1D_MKCIP4_1]|uniref:MFS transporter n=1 Tax=Stenotrophomonas sp. ESTM1D_MKCIP4_1 TaxID=2072414 RepID=UPI001C1F2B0A|nr:MFS transporter [Stenotrophomonas sp. ESTM1D_MKCIP4_1]
MTARAHSRDQNRAERGLDGLNFFLADVRDGLGPYLAIYLLSVHHWQPASIGVVMTVAAIIGLLTQTPAGAFMDRVHAKRLTLAIAAIVVTASCLLLPWTQGFAVVASTQALSAVAASVIAPAIAAISLGVSGPRAFARRMGRNETFNHAGNVVAALLAGGLAYLWGPTVVFYLMAVMTVASVVATGVIPAAAIDDARARGSVAEAAGAAAPSSGRLLLRDRRLLLLAACSCLFHLANAAMLPLVGQKLSLSSPALATTMTAGCIVAAQLVMIPMAWLVGARADRWGRRPLLLAGFLILPIRAALYPLSDAPAWLLGVQLLDGIGAGIFGALIPIIVSDLSEGTGRFNVTLGAVSTVFGVGGALSPALAGVIVQRAGYDAAFLTLAVIAAAAVLLAWQVPETRSIPATTRN